MPYHTDLLNWGVERFLASYAVEVRGGMGHLTHHSNQNVQALLNSVGFTYGGPQNSQVRLDAPLVRAYFGAYQARTNADKLPFAVEVLRVQLDTDDGNGTNVPVYLIPYEGGRGLGVKLPSHAMDGLPNVYAMTASQNGCTVEISGPPQSPYASHTNVIDQAAATKQTKMAQRVARLQQRFEDAERAALGLLPGAPLPLANDPTQQRVQLRHYAPPVHFPGQNVGYSGDVTNIINALDAQTRLVGQQLKGGRVETGTTTHTRYLYKPTGATVANLTNAAAPPNALVIGHRTNGNWTFYYQEWAGLNFKVREVRKIGPKWVTSNQWLMNANGTKREFNCVAVLNHGQLWPPPTTHHALW